ncbi:hypothetical protein CYMTET_11520 [Cymbomonas tetramitiformis]|uniref:Integrase catalytic domain-containing protein n=1 Tax=Cymbomonas tetramitiformis TaxID=36881 RepID=A0AAE0GMD2_9CHLO|nr:hypothetical protein CYMTET_11520 [Cymbomonas tetramitiformis]
MSKTRDKAKVVERSPPGLGVEPTYGELSEERKPDGLSVGEDSAALTTLIDERQQQLFSQQVARLNELMKMVQVLAQAVPQLVANQNAGTGNAIACPEAAESSMAGSSVKSRVVSGTVDVPLPLLTDMLKGFPNDKLYSGQEAETDSKWLESRGKIVPSLRHPAMALFLSDTRELEDIKKDEKFSVAANQLFHDFLSRVTTRTANAVVRSYSTEADGVSAWRQLIKMRRSTGSAYFVRQVKALLDDTKRFATLAPPLQGFLNAREVLDRVEEYACTSKFLPGGEKFHVASLEAVFVAMVLNSLNPAYVHIRTMFSGDELPSFKKLNDAVCDLYDNVIATSAAATETGAGIVEDRRKQAEQKRVALLKRVPCPVCHMTGHSSSECFVTNEEKREAYLKRNPKRREAIMKRVQDYQKHGKLPDRAAAVAETGQHPGVDDTSEALYAICELVEDNVVTCLSDDLPEFISGCTVGGYTTSQSGISLCNYYSVLDGLTSSEGPTPVGGGDQPMSGTYRAIIVLERPHFPVDGRVVDHEKVMCAKRVVAEQFGLLRRMLEKEPVMVRGSFEKLQSWVTLLSMVTRDTVQAVETFWALLGYDCEDEWDSGSSSDGDDHSDQDDYDSGDSSHRGDVSSDRGDPQLVATPDAYVIYGIEQIVVPGPADRHAWSHHPLPGLVITLDDSGVSIRTPEQVVADQHAWSHHALAGDNYMPGLSDPSDSDDDGYASDTVPDLVDASDSDEEDDAHSCQPFEGVGGIPSDDWASGLFCHHGCDDSDCSIPDLDSTSDSDSDEEDGMHSWQPFEGVGGIPSDDWASGLFRPSRKYRLCAKGTESGIGGYCSSDWYYDEPDLEDASDLDEGEDMHSWQPFEGVGGIPSDDWASGLLCPSDLEDGSDSGDEDACELREGLPVGRPLTLYVASADDAADILARALPLTAFGGKVAMIDSGATKHIFNMVSDFGDDFDPASCSTFSVVQAGTVCSEGSGTVTFAKLDVSTGRAVGLQFTGAHCIPGRPFNLVSVVALEDAGFSVDFGARQISSGGVTFSFSRVGNQYIIYEDQMSGTLDTYMACAAYHDDSDRDKTDQKFEEAGKHIEQHGPFTLELFASVDNHILDEYCTTDNPCFGRDWVGKACYGNPPYEHDTILRCLQKALSDFARAPQSTKFLLVLPRWETASWWQFISLFTIVHEYPAGEKIFSAPLDSCYNVENLEMCGKSRVWVRETKWPVVVICKDGHTVIKLDVKMLAHVRLGHIGDVTMQEMLDEEVPMGITVGEYAKSLVWHCPERCISCRLTKMIRPSTKSTGRECAAEIGLLVWSDTCGPFRPSAGGYRWFVLFVDDCAAWICVYFLKRKSDYLATLEQFLAEVRQHRSRMNLVEKYHMVLHTNGDSTMIAGQTQQYCKDQIFSLSSERSWCRPYSL